MPVVTCDIETLLAQSTAGEAFKAAVRDLARGRKSDLIGFGWGAPPVKVLRVISKLLETEPSLEISEVNLDGHSGCSDFEGTVHVNGNERTYEFRWDCEWRAKQEGFRDAFGYPDQIRAAQEFGYQCFERFERIA
jgi:hypothetical protein